MFWILNYAINDFTSVNNINYTTNRFNIYSNIFISLVTNLFSKKYDNRKIYKHPILFISVSINITNTIISAGKMDKSDKSEQILRKIKEILKKDTKGMTIQELSEEVKSPRITTAMALAKLEGAELINVRVVGNCKLHYWKGRKK